MNELLVISQGWLGYLERWPVSLQLLVGLGPLLALTLVGRRLPRQHPLQRRRRLWTLAAMALGTGLLGAFGVATGLAVSGHAEKHSRPRVIQPPLGLVTPGRSAETSAGRVLFMIRTWVMISKIQNAAT